MKKNAQDIATIFEGLVAANRLGVNLTIDHEGMVALLSEAAVALRGSEESNEQVAERIVQQWGEGKKIHAIKDLRGETGMTLKDAKDAIEAAYQRLGIPAS